MKTRPLTPDENWQTTAQALGWPETDIRTLVELLAMRGEPERVVEIGSQQILIERPITYAISGTDKHGAESTREIKSVGRWSWYRNDPPVNHITNSAADEEDPWCPGHGYDCRPTREQVCGAIITSRETCACPIQPHRFRCENQFRVANERCPLCGVTAHLAECHLSEGDIKQTPAPKLEPDTKSTPTYVLAPVQKPKASNGWKLPGQQRLIP